MAKKRKREIDDGYAPDLVFGAQFDGELEIPIVQGTWNLTPPHFLCPFSRRGATSMADEYICFYEHDFKFRKLIENASRYLTEISRKFRGIVSPDCSLYRDMPLVLQIMNTYLNRAVGHYFQSHGMKVIPNVRWGDRRSYYGTNHIEPFAFLGVERGSVVSIGTYGCISGEDNRLFFREGLLAMLKALEPLKVLVYGNLPDDILTPEAKRRTEFIRYTDWTTLMRKGGK